MSTLPAAASPAWSVPQDEAVHGAAATPGPLLGRPILDPVQPATRGVPRRRRSSRAQETCRDDLEPRPVRATPETENARCANSRRSRWENPALAPRNSTKDIPSLT